MGSWGPYAGARGWGLGLGLGLGAGAHRLMAKGPEAGARGQGPGGGSRLEASKFAWVLRVNPITRAVCFLTLKFSHLQLRYHTQSHEYERCAFDYRCSIS